MRSFVLNRHGRVVLPSNLLADIDFTGLDSLEALEGLIRRDFEEKAPTGAELLRRIESGAYATRYELLRDLAPTPVLG